MSNLIRYNPGTDEHTIIALRSQRIVSMETKDAVLKTLNTISDIFPMYNIAQDDKVFARLAMEIVSTFPQLAIAEIPIAFRLFASATLDLDETVQFYGKANMQTIGKILNAYIIHRRRIIAAQDNEAEYQRLEAEMAERQKKEANDLIENFPQEIKDFDKPTWEDVPLFWYDLADKLGMLAWRPGEKKEIYEEAKELARKEPAPANDLISIRSHAKKLLNNGRREVVISKKLAVWRKVLKKK